MKKVFNFGQVGKTGTVQEVVPLMVKYGIEAIDVPPELLNDPKALKEADKCVKDHGLVWGLVPTPMDSYSEKTSDEEFAKGVETIKRWAEAASSVGANRAYNHVWNGSDARTYEAQYEWVLNRVRQLFFAFEEGGVQYGLEFLGPVPLRSSFRYPFFNNIAGILALANEVSPRCGFVFDTYHWYTGANCDMGMLYLAATNIDRMVGFHVNDGIAGRTREEQQDQERAMPLTTGVIDARVPYELFKSRGYDGVFLCEPLAFWKAEVKDLSMDETMRRLAEGYERLTGK